MFFGFSRSRVPRRNLSIMEAVSIINLDDGDASDVDPEMTQPDEVHSEDEATVDEDGDDTTKLVRQRPELPHVGPLLRTTAAATPTTAAPTPTTQAKRSFYGIVSPQNRIKIKLQRFRRLDYGTTSSEVVDDPDTTLSEVIDDPAPVEHYDSPVAGPSGESIRSLTRSSNMTSASYSESDEESGYVSCMQKRRALSHPTGPPTTRSAAPPVPSPPQPALTPPASTPQVTPVVSPESSDVSSTELKSRKRRRGPLRPAVGEPLLQYQSATEGQGWHYLAQGPKPTLACCVFIE